MDFCIMDSINFQPREWPGSSNGIDRVLFKNQTEHKSQPLFIQKTRFNIIDTTKNLNMGTQKLID